MLKPDPQPACNAALRASILAGDVSGVMEAFDRMDTAERTANLPAVRWFSMNRWSMYKPGPDNPWNVAEPPDKQGINRRFRAIELARFMCDPEQPVSDYWMHIGIEDIAAFRQRYKLEHAAPLTDRQLQGDHQWHYRNHVHRAVIAGLIARPQTEEYLQSLFFGDLRQPTNIVLRHVEADPGLAPCLLELFDREGPSDASFAAVEKYCHDPDLYWSSAFLTLCERGVYTRAQLIDRTLSTLGSDWPQFKAGWFSRFHELLAPSVDEMAPFVPRYLALCHSRIAPTVSLAVDAVALLYRAGLVDAEQMCEAMQPVLSSAVKARVLSALGLLGQVIKRFPQAASSITAIALQALAHANSDVQKKVIACLQEWGMDTAAQAAAREYVPFVAAVNQPALSRLLGEQAAAVPAPPLRDAVALVAPMRSALLPLDPLRALQPLDGVAELIERLACVLENPADIDEWERVADALVRLSPIPEEQRAAFAALKKRAKRLRWGSHPLGFAIARLMACAVDAEETSAEMVPVHAERASSTHAFIARRTLGLIAQAREGRGLPPLSSATHRGGFIDPRQLVARVAAREAAGAPILLSEQVFALMRLVPATRDADAARSALQAAQALKDAGFVQVLRYALGGTAEVPTGAGMHAQVAAAGRLRCVAPVMHAGSGGASDARFDWHVERTTPNQGDYVFHHLRVTCAAPVQAANEYDYGALLAEKHMEGEWGDRDAEIALIVFDASLAPSDLDAFFAEGARGIGTNLDWWEANWQHRAYLDVLLYPTTALTPMARLVLALGLAGKEPGQAALAVDALVTGLQDGRLDRLAMGGTLARLWATPLVKGPRLAKRLAQAAQAHAELPAAVFALLCAMIEGSPDGTRKDMAAPLELLLELKFAGRLALPASTRSVLTGMRLSGKSKVAVQAILS